MGGMFNFNSLLYVLNPLGESDSFCFLLSVSSLSGEFAFRLTCALSGVKVSVRWSGPKGLLYRTSLSVGLSAFLLAIYFGLGCGPLFSVLTPLTGFLVFIFATGPV